MRHTTAFSFAVLIILCSSCSTSLLYDPTLRMPARQLRTSEVQASGGWGLLPESRPDAVNGRRSDDAFIFDGRAGLSKRVTLLARGWIGMDGVLDRNGLWGVAGSIQYAVDTSTSGWRSVLQMCGGWSASGQEIGGFGGSLNYILYTPAIAELQPYLSAGGMLGFLIESWSDWGLAPLLHAGASWEPLEDVGLNAELTSIFQINVKENVFHTILTPSVSLYVRF